jgi:hypothetical protein
MSDRQIFIASFSPGIFRLIVITETTVSLHPTFQSTAPIRSVLTPAAADYTIDWALQLISERQRDRADVPERLDTEARRLRKELERLVLAIVGGTAPASVLAEIKRREVRLAEIEEERKHSQSRRLRNPRSGDCAGRSVST